MNLIIYPNDDYSRFKHSLYKLICDFGKDMNVGKEENNYNPLSNNAYRGKLKSILSFLEVWALKKYDMFIRFTYDEDNAVDMIEIAWEHLDEVEIEEVLLNMYPEETNETTR